MVCTQSGADSDGGGPVLIEICDINRRHEIICWKAECTLDPVSCIACLGGAARKGHQKSRGGRVLADDVQQLYSRPFNYGLAVRTALHTT